MAYAERHRHDLPKPPKKSSPRKRKTSAPPSLPDLPPLPENLMMEDDFEPVPPPLPPRNPPAVAAPARRRITPTLIAPLPEPVPPPLPPRPAALVAAELPPSSVVKHKKKKHSKSKEQARKEFLKAAFGPNYSKRHTVPKPVKKSSQKVYLEDELERLPKSQREDLALAHKELQEIDRKRREERQRLFSAFLQ